MKKKFWLRVILFTGLISIVLIIKMLMQHGGFSHPESNAFLQIYTDPELTLAQKIFNPQLTDWNHYQARELSYLADWVDAQIILAGCKWRHSGFYSFISVILLIVTIGAQQYLAAKLLPHVNKWSAALFSLAFALSSAAECTIFFRSAKQLTCCFTTLMLVSLYELWVKQKSGSGSRTTANYWFFGIFALLLPYCDRQGCFIIAVAAAAGGLFCIICSFNFIKTKYRISCQLQKNLLFATFIVWDSMLLSTMYNLFIAPALIERISGYTPSFAFQHLPERAIFNFAGGVLYLLDNTGHFFCGANEWTAVITGAVIPGVWFLLLKQKREKNPAIVWFNLIWLGIFCAMLLSANLMTARHPLMLRPDVIHCNYFLPMAAMLLLMLLISLELLCKNGSQKNTKYLTTATSGIMLLAIFIPLMFPATYPDDHLKFYRYSGTEVLKAIDDDKFDYNQVPLPYSTLKLIEHIKKLQ